MAGMTTRAPSSRSTPELRPEQCWSAAVDAAPDPIALMAPDGAVLAANAAFRAAFRFAVGPARPPWGRVAPPPFEEGGRIFEAPAPDGRAFEWRERLLQDGRRVACARDVTARTVEAATAGRAKTALFATLTHELRTPLNGVLGMAGLLARTPLDASQQEYVAALRRSGEHLLDLINEILDFSRLEAGRIVLDDAPFDLGAVIQDVVELLSPKAHDKRLELVVRVSPALPAQLSGDAGRLRQVLFNLIGNAVKFTDAGGVAVAASPAGPGRVRISVRDTGPGVPEDKQALIFEEFAQADAAHARLHGGAGLGLAIVRKLTATMGGSVSLFSRPGEGATFTIDLPFAAVSSPAADAPLRGVRVTLISPNPVIQADGAALLRDLGAQVQAGPAAPRNCDADVILLDHPAGAQAPLRLPQSAPVIVLAPQEERAAIAAYQARGVQHYLLKPLRVRSLVERVRAVIERTPAAAPALRDDREADPIGDGALAGLRVLVADDNPINALLARTVLTRAGCAVQVVADGEEAMRAVLAAAPPFDLALLDLRMPGVDGFAAARLIRASAGASAAIPLIALTADSAEEDRKAALAAGMDDFLTKPIDLARLMRAVARFTGRQNPATVGSGAANGGAAARFRSG
jgi:signal transduction histidine kinase/CheY-like chemotaxis protein